MGRLEDNGGDSGRRCAGNEDGDSLPHRFFWRAMKPPMVCKAEMTVDAGWITGIYNSVFSGAPADVDYRVRNGVHNAQFNAALGTRGQTGVTE